MPVINLIETGKNIENMRKNAGITVKEEKRIYPVCRLLFQ